MTETQAKSGAAGASTDAGDPRVETPEATEKDAAEAKSTGSSDSPAKTIRNPSGTTSSSPSNGGTSDGASDKSTSGAGSGSAPAGASSSAGGSTSGGSSAGGSAGTPLTAKGPASSYTPTAVPSTPPAPVTKVDDARSEEPTVKTSPGVPIVAGTSAGSPVKTASGRGTSTGRSTGTASVTSTTSGPATGTATVKPGKSTGPVVARATVGGTTTVTGAGLRQTTGATSVVTPPTTRGGAASAAAVGAARVSEAVRSARATVTGAASRGPRRARLHLKRIDPWSVMKFSFAVSLVLFVVAIVATSVLYLALDAMKVFDSINNAFAEVTGQAGGSADAFKITAKGVIGTAVLLGAVNMVLFTALMTLGAFVYNVCADLVGGVELTLSEKE